MPLTDYGLAPKSASISALTNLEPARGSKFLTETHPLRLWVVVDGEAESKRRVRGCTELEGSEHSGKALERIAFLASINYGVIQIRVRKSQQLEARTKQCAVMFFIVICII